MPLFRRGLPRRAAIAAFIGFVYSVLLLGSELAQGLSPAPAIAWFALSIALLFGHAVAYYGFVAWGLLWVAWRGVLAFQGKAGPLFGAALDVVVPLVAVALLSSSGYLLVVREPREDEGS